MALSVKAYLYFDYDEPEIRRFSVDQEVSANYTYIVQKIKSVFPKLLRKDITLFWKDKDEELITFSTDDELIEALASITGTVFKIYIRETAGKDPKQKCDQKKEEVKFPGVVCDGCESGITGVRFKCLGCPDYDLCGTCEATGMHREHVMLRIRMPGQQFPWNIGEMLRGFGLHGGPNIFPGRGPCRRGRGHWRWGPFHGQGPHAGCPWMRQQTPAQPNEEQPSTSSTGSQQEQPTDQSSEIPVGPPFLHAMGQAVASFLNPFGIDVHTYTDDDSVCCEGKCDVNCCPNKGKTAPNTAAESNSGNEEPKGETKTGNNEDTTNSTPPTPPTPSEPKACVESMVTEDEQSESSGYVLVDNKTDFSSTSTSQSVDPVNYCIEQLRMMGFDTQGSWFKTLVEAKNGDISQVLDALQPSQ